MSSSASHGVRTQDNLRKWCGITDEAELKAATEMFESMIVTEAQRLQAEGKTGLVVLPGVLDMIAALQPSMWPMWAIVTSATRIYASRALPTAGIPHPPEFITADDVKKGKPDPEPYLLGAERIGVEPTECESLVNMKWKGRADAQVSWWRMRRPVSRLVLRRAARCLRYVRAIRGIRWRDWERLGSWMICQSASLLSRTPFRADAAGSRQSLYLVTLSSSPSTCGRVARKTRTAGDEYPPLSRFLSLLGIGHCMHHLSTPQPVSVISSVHTA